jgi:hypothetical protein
LYVNGYLREQVSEAPLVIEGGDERPVPEFAHDSVSDPSAQIHATGRHHGEGQVAGLGAACGREDVERLDAERVRPGERVARDHSGGVLLLHFAVHTHRLGGMPARGQIATWFEETLKLPWLSAWVMHGWS